MSVSLSMLAHARLAAAPLPAQRYGLGVMLRRPYPDVRKVPWETRDLRSFSVEGAPLERSSWKDVPEELGDLLRRRVTDDSLAAFHVLHDHAPATVLLRKSGSVTIHSLLEKNRVRTLVIDVAPGVSVDVHEENELVGGECTSALILLRVRRGASVRWLTHASPTRAVVIVERLAVLHGDAILDHTGVAMHAAALRDTLSVVLAEPGATVGTRTLLAGAGDNQFDMSVTVEHRAPRTVSDVRARSVLGGSAQAVLRGLVKVEPAAYGADGYQRFDTLLLSPTAEVDPVPMLEIETNDVRCTHGVTTGHLHPEQLFYLQSRGCSMDAARALLISGFARDVLERFPEGRRAELQKSVQQVVSEAS